MPNSGSRESTARRCAFETRPWRSTKLRICRCVEFTGREYSAALPLAPDAVGLRHLVADQVTLPRAAEAMTPSAGDEGAAA